MSEAEKQAAADVERFFKDIIELARLTTTLAERQITHSDAIVSLIKRMNELEARQWTKEHVRT